MSTFFGSTAFLKTKKKQKKKTVNVILAAVSCFCLEFLYPVPAF